MEVELDATDGTVSVFGDDDVDNVFVGRVGFGAVFAVEEHDDVGVLFDRTRFAQVGELRHLVGARFDGARELGEREDGDIEFAGELFESAGYFGNFLDAVVAASSAAPFHELEVVDNDEPELMFRLEAARHGAHFHNIDRAGVVDKDRRFAQGADGVADQAEIIVLEFAGSETPEIHIGMRGDHAIDELVRTHFEREYADGNFGVDADLARDVECEGGFSDGGARCEDDEVGFLESREESVEIGESSGDAAEGVIALVELVDTLEGVFENGLDGNEVLFDEFLRDFEEALFGLVELLLDIFAFVVAHFGDIASGGDEAAERRFSLHEFGVVGDIGSTWDAVDESGKRRGTAHGVYVTLFFEAVGNGEDIDRFARFVELDHGFVDHAVYVAVKVVCLENIGDFGDGVFVEHERSQDRLLRLFGMRRHAEGVGILYFGSSG